MESLSPFLFLFYFYLFSYLFIYVFIYLFIYLLIYLFICFLMTKKLSRPGVVREGVSMKLWSLVKLYQRIRFCN